jgi:hypothetical protein
VQNDSRGSENTFKPKSPASPGFFFTPFDKLIELLVKQLAIPLSHQSTMAKWLVITQQTTLAKSLVIRANGDYYFSNFITPF